jgi:hypothetical protein
MDELQRQSDEIRKLAGRRPTPDRRRVLTEALRSKWEGSQALAVKTLAEWGDRESIEAIRDYLLAAFDRKSSWAVRGVAVQALAPLIGKEDANWITELCRSRTSGLERHELRPLINRVSALTRGSSPRCCLMSTIDP